jgi:hypothetical protein
MKYDVISLSQAQLAEFVPSDDPHPSLPRPKPCQHLWSYGRATDWEKSLGGSCLRCAACQG